MKETKYLIYPDPSWSESLTGQLSQEDLKMLRDEIPSQIVDNLFWSRGAPIHAAAISEVLARDVRKAARVARGFCIGHRDSAPDQYIRLAFDRSLLDTLLEAPIAELPETGLSCFPLTERSK